MQRTRVRMVAVMMSLAAGFLMAGCTGLGRRVEPPQVHLVDIRIQEVRPLETVLDVKLRVMNNSDRGLFIRGVDCRLDINGKPFANGVTNAEIDIPPYETQIVPMTFYASVWEVLQSITKILGRSRESGPVETLSYGLTGHLALGGGAWGTARIPFTAEGAVDFSHQGQ